MVFFFLEKCGIIYWREEKMTSNKEVEFNKIVNDILKNKKFIDLKYEIHHGISRLDHSLHVARITYLWCRACNMPNIEEVTRAALLHDFYSNAEVGKNAFVNHPTLALKNAQREFALTKKQQNIIASHMFPTCKKMPNCKESLIVSTVDKLVAIYELTKYKVPIEIGAVLLFVFNFLVIHR